MAELLIGVLIGIIAFVAFVILTVLVVLLGSVVGLPLVLLTLAACLAVSIHLARSHKEQ